MSMVLLASSLWQLGQGCRLSLISESTVCRSMRRSEVFIIGSSLLLSLYFHIWFLFSLFPFDFPSGPIQPLKYHIIVPNTSMTFPVKGYFNDSVHVFLSAFIEYNLSYECLCFDSGTFIPFLLSGYHTSRYTILVNGTQGCFAHRWHALWLIRLVIIQCRRDNRTLSNPPMQCSYGTHRHNPIITHNAILFWYTKAMENTSTIHYYQTRLRTSISRTVSNPEETT